MNSIQDNGNSFLGTAYTRLNNLKPLGKSVSLARAEGTERGRNSAETNERKEGRNEGFDASGAIIRRRSNNGTKATDVVCTSI